MKLIKLVNAGITLSEQANQSVAPTLAYKIMKFIKSSEPDRSFYEVRFREIIDKYSVKDESGEFERSKNGGIHILQENIEAYTKELEELNNVEVDAPDIKFKLSELNEFKMSVREIFTLDEFLEED